MIFVVIVWTLDLLVYGICNRQFYFRDMSSLSSLVKVVLALSFSKFCMYCLHLHMI